MVTAAQARTAAPHTLSLSRGRLLLSHRCTSALSERALHCQLTVVQRFCSKDTIFEVTLGNKAEDVEDANSCVDLGKGVCRVGTFSQELLLAIQPVPISDSPR